MIGSNAFLPDGSAESRDLKSLGEEMGKWLNPERLTQSILLQVFFLAIASSAFARKPPAVTFKYSGGSENVPAGCKGLVEVGASALTFKCPQGSFSVPYSSIDVMEYRPDISRKILRMKISWTVRPPVVAPIMVGKKNRYFTIVYQEQGETRGVVLDVAPERMRPYLAEIDVKAGKRVEVKETEDYDEAF
jgi:hypothetical protein